MSASPDTLGRVRRDATPVALFDQTQKPPRWFLMVLHTILAGLLVVIVVLPFDNAPAWRVVTTYLVAVLGIGGAMLLIESVALRVVVSRGGLVISYHPFTTLRIPLDQIERVEPSDDIQPIARFGGWGIKYGVLGGAWCYTIRGRGGVCVYQAGQPSIVVGTDQPRALAEVIDQLRHETRAG